MKRKKNYSRESSSNEDEMFDIVAEDYV